VLDFIGQLALLRLGSELQVVRLCYTTDTVERGLGIAIVPTTSGGIVFDMDATQVVFGVLAPLVISIGSTYAVIRLSPERKDLKRVRELLERNAADKEQQRLANEFRCDVQIIDMLTDGAKVIFRSETPFCLKQVQLATELNAPLSSIEPKTGTSTSHEVAVAAEDISKVYFSQTQGTQRTGLLTFTALVNGQVVERKRAVTVLQLTCANPVGSGQRVYYALDC
jgi:hypothetical protein